ncbi:MAG: cytochrome bc complex cytochrome b subunit [Zoogloeaceae bacterium]|jgi:ubiquinol-cytochrome c reductase cytochrome b subunit|nr:cytochrome bc complex cytochrome b subunit [Zoogloeaceae bacterium]
MATNSNYEKFKSDGSILGCVLEWVDARFPLTSMWKAHLSEYYAPKNFNFWYYFGSLALLVLVLQVVTGIFLAMNYKPDASLNVFGVPVAFDSLNYITHDVNWGWLIRNMHSTGASAFFIVVYLHMFRGMLYGSYRKPRELVWIFGILIFLCLMAEAFMGYLLPWGQMSLWGAQVIVNLFGAIPLVGEPLSIWVRGDFVVGDATLNRFFAFHVVAVPLVLIGLVAAHVLALHEVGSNNPDGIEIKKLKNEKGIPLDGIPFHPYYTVKDIVGVVVFLMLFSFVVFFWPEGGGYFLEYNNFFQADPMKTPAHIAPVWYFTPFYSMLRAMVWNFFWLDAKFWGVVAMGGGVVILAFLPWLDRSPVKSIRYRGPIYKTLLAIFVFTFLVLGFLGTKVPGYYFFGYSPATNPDGSVIFSPLNYLLSGDLIAQVFTVYYFLFFLTMPWWSRVDKYKPEPERVTWK